ncbi:MAG: transposase [Caldilineaceae bacterium]|nr:transposase [Caldilineaceae bacterium]
MAEQPDLTLHELQSRLHEELRLRASIGRLWNLLREMGLRPEKTLYAAELLYLPPCSPDFNPIEACWGRSSNNCAAPRPARWPRSKHALPTPSLP